MPEENGKKIKQLFPESPTLRLLAQGIKHEVDFKKEEIQEQQEYLMKIKEEYEEAREHMGTMLSDKHLVIVKSPEYINQLINFPEKKKKTSSLLQQSQKASFMGMNVSQQSSIALFGNQSKL